MTGTWPLSWATGDLMQAAEFKKGIGCISDTTLGSPAANVDVTSIVGTYAHLMVIAYARSSTAAANTNINLRFNNDTASNYDSQLIYGSASGNVANETFATTLINCGLIPAASAGSNLFGITITFVPHYAGSSNNKVALTLAAMKQGTSSGSLTNALTGGFWRSNAAVTRVTLLPSAGNFAAGTRVSIYGMGA